MLCLNTHVQMYTLPNTLKAWSTGKLCFRKKSPPQWVNCILIEEGKSEKHIFLTIFSLFSLHRFMDYGVSRKPLFHPYPLCMWSVNFILLTHFPKKLSVLTFVDRCQNISQQKATACVVNSKMTRFCRYFAFYSVVGIQSNETASLLLYGLSSWTSELDISISTAFIKMWNWAIK